MNRGRPKIAVAAAVLLAGAIGAGVLASCSNYQSSHDYNAPPPGTVINGNWVRIEDPGNFPSIIRECIAGDGIYIAQDGANGPEVVPHDPACLPGASQRATWNGQPG